jgi:3-phosphoshikimate 1-carboxyvinyltransferase
MAGGTTRFRQTPSSQFVSALLMAAPHAQRDVMIDAGADMPSKPYVAMTLGVMEAFGVSALEEKMRKFIVPARQTYRATSYTVEPDATAASYFFAAAALTGGRVTIKGLGRESCQGDMGFVDVLERMGCRAERGTTETTLWGPKDGRLQGVDVDLNAMPDVAQTLAVLAAFAEGPTRIRNVANMRVKETDRIAALCTELGVMGVKTEAYDDGLSVTPGEAPRACSIETYDDHRMAMSFALAGLRLEGLTILDAECVEKTFPAFFDTWAALVKD